jgi:ABC-type cobalamin/Fe3+-siderophores transport system ATPase subunit
MHYIMNKNILIKHKTISNNIQFNNFDLNESIDNKHYCIIGNQGSGKSTLIKNII